jgi:hypothetical protein
MSAVNEYDDLHMQGLKTTRVKNTGKREKTKAVYEGSG